jgi:hypothetical protein
MPPADERLRHLFLAGTARTLPFTTPNRGGKHRGSLDRDPDRHGRALAAELSRIAEAQSELFDLRKSHQLEEVTGTPVTFELLLNPALSLDSLEDRRAGIELLSFRSTGEDTGVAVVFIPEGKLGVFEDKLKAYLDPERLTKKGKRYHQRLINSIDRIRRTVLQDLWTDPLREFPGEDLIWWEVWVRNQAGVDRFRSHAERLEIQVGERSLRFPDRTVVLARATVEQMALSVDLLDSIAELREARSLALELLAMGAQEEVERTSELESRTESPPEDSPAVCLLDTGIDVGHPLLEPGLDSEDAHSYDEVNWGVDDHHGHGTEMGGFALYGGDLDHLLLSGEPVTLRHRLESVKILPRQGDNPPELYGEITLASAARVESHNPTRRRAFSLSVTAGSCPDGTPTSWSGAVDQFCMAAQEEAGVPHRLLFVASGNASTGEGYSYPDSNHTDCIQDPAQAWNAITVGAYTQKDLIHEVDCQDWAVVAPAGDMSPCNTTSLTWREEWPQKPDLVIEGGNMAWEPATGVPDALESLSLLTTRRRSGSGLLCWSGDTSGATATVARMGALVLAEYADLDLWPETIRALLVHSARWTPAMQARFIQHSRRDRMDRLLRCYGYGVPDLDRALYSLRHQLTLVIQERIQPFRIQGTDAKTNEMHLHSIPWPSDILADLGATPVRMRVTLSYFIEPKPGRRGTSRRYRYASHGLRFEVKTAVETEAEFLARVNRALREPEEAPSGSSSDSATWEIGPRFRSRGSIHSDVWAGSAADLAAKDSIAVFPVLGWWRDPKRPEHCERWVRYSLVASIETDAAEVEVEGVTQAVDFYTEIVNAIEVAPEIEVLGL